MRSIRWCAYRPPARACGLVVCLGLLGVSVSAGCSGPGENPADAAQRRGPLPYHVGVYLDTERLPYHLPPQESEPHKVRYLGDDEVILGMVRESLCIENPVVSQVEVLEARNLRDALAAAKGLDLLIAVGFETADEYTQHQRKASWGALEVFAWFFGGFGSWFVPTVEYDAPTTLSLESLDLHQPRVRQWYNGNGRSEPDFDWPAEFQAEREDTSLFKRSNQATHYLLTILVPPMALASEATDRTSATLTEAVNTELCAQLVKSVRDRLLSEDWVKPLTVVFVAPNPLEVVDGDAIDLELSIANRQGGALRSVEVQRLAPKAKDYAWQASADELADLDAAFAALEDPGDYVPFRVSQSIPVAPGANLVKVLLVHENGERVVRTMLYVK